MSQENVEIVTRFLDAYNAGELDSAVEMCTPDVTVTPDHRVMLQDPKRGHDAARVFLAETRSEWTSVGIHPTEVRDLGDGRVMVRADLSGTGRASGAGMSMNLTTVYTVRGGEIAAASFFFDHREALEAAGLEG